MSQRGGLRDSRGRYRHHDVTFTIDVPRYLARDIERVCNLEGRSRQSATVGLLGLGLDAHAALLAHLRHGPWLIDDAAPIISQAMSRRLTTELSEMAWRRKRHGFFWKHVDPENVSDEDFAAAQLPSDTNKSK